ncbi:hypothetical protein FOPE_12639 [Fonsecaea pedrosoi]|nr:hypothetical protein FOPE_12639 [Fonsecaea pedrosoi]
MKQTRRPRKETTIDLRLRTWTTGTSYFLLFLGTLTKSVGFGGEKVVVVGAWATGFPPGVHRDLLGSAAHGPRPIYRASQPDLGDFTRYLKACQVPGKATATPKTRHGQGGALGVMLWGNRAFWTTTG